jgi:hypothetical protein
MAKPGRNDPCPCGSGNKYKKWRLPKEEAVEREQLAKTEARRAERAAAHRLHLREVKAAIAARLSGTEDADEDELTIASNAAADLVRASKLDEAEQAARDLLVRFPEVHDGYDRLGMVYEARGENQQAADCYRKVIAFVRSTPTTTTPASRTCSSSSWIGSTRRPPPDRGHSVRAPNPPPSQTILTSSGIPTQLAAAVLIAPGLWRCPRRRPLPA